MVVKITVASVWTRLGDIGVALPDELGAEQLAGGGVAGDADLDRCGARVVGLVVVWGRLAGDSSSRRAALTSSRACPAKGASSPPLLRKE
jgi:hypothetical protein